jgi:quercetin dioxygenase-like cupin family protein
VSISFTVPPVEIDDDGPVSTRRAVGSPEGIAPGYVLDPGTGPTRWFMEALFTMKARGPDTDHQFSLVEQYVPRGFAAPAHRHVGTTEGFYVLDGQMDFAVGDTVFTDITAGGFVYVSRDTRHEFRVTSATAKFLLITTPGGFEKYFEELSSPAQANTFPYTDHRKLSPDEVLDAKKRWDAMATNDGTLLPALPH